MFGLITVGNRPLHQRKLACVNMNVVPSQLRHLYRLWKKITLTLLSDLHSLDVKVVYVYIHPVLMQADDYK